MMPQIAKTPVLLTSGSLKPTLVLLNTRPTVASVQPQYLRPSLAGWWRMKKKLTKRAVDIPSPRDTRYVVWDTETNGFRVRVNRDGTKTFALKYFGGGKQRWLPTCV